MLTNLDQ